MFVSWLSGNLKDVPVDRLVTERLGVEHPMARHIGAFLTDCPTPTLRPRRAAPTAAI